MPKGVSLVWTDEMLDWLKSNVKGRHYADLASKINHIFGKDYSADAVSACALRHGWRNGIDGKIKKGNIPFNKGKKVSAEVYAKCKATMFAKGNRPHNWVPVGSERILRDGYVEVKVAEPRTWKLKHVVVWEKYNGKVDKGECVIFLDGNRQNCDINNLRKISRRQNAGMSRNRLWQKDKELNNTALNIVDLMIAVTDRKKDER